MEKQAFLVAALLLISVGCSCPTEPEEERVLGLVSVSALGENPMSWVVEGRRFKVAITTEGSCEATGSDWDVVQTDGYLDDPGFVFILPYEYRLARCPSSHFRAGSTVLFTDTMELEFEFALEAEVRVVDRDGAVYDMTLDFHPGWPAQGAAGNRLPAWKEE